eukprot:696341-Prorocentrum_minimum.AAC.1
MRTTLNLHLTYAHRSPGSKSGIIAEEDRIQSGCMSAVCKRCPECTRVRASVRGVALRQNQGSAFSRGSMVVVARVWKR